MYISHRIDLCPNRHGGFEVYLKMCIRDRYYIDILISTFNKENYLKKVVS